MNRIFYPLALLAVASMSCVMGLGLWLHSKDVRDASDRETQRLATVHRLSGIAAGLSVLLVDSVVITYFVGTSRWCKEVSETYGLAPGFVQSSNRLKRSTFPQAVVSMLTVVGITALGGAADPAAQMSLEPLQNLVGGGLAWADVHLFGALAGIALILYGFYVMSNNISANLVVINEVMAEVKRMRSERGLD